jgi:hypothetical protein
MEHFNSILFQKSRTANKQHAYQSINWCEVASLYGRGGVAKTVLEYDQSDTTLLEKYLALLFFANTCWWLE